MSVTLRDLAAPGLRRASPALSRARRRAARSLRLLAARSRARRISIGALIALTALTAAPAASFAEAPSAPRRSPVRPAAAAPALTPYEVELITGGTSGHARLLQSAFAPADTGGTGGLAATGAAGTRGLGAGASGTGGLAADAAAGTQIASASRAHHATRAPAGERYVNPLPGGFAPGRTDMGVDFTAHAGRPILAIGRARILGIHPDWYPPGGPRGGNLLEYRLLNGRDAGRRVYVAEQIAVTVHPGETVRAGAVIGRYAASGTGIETGWAAGGGTTLAQASTGYSEGEVTAAGRSFRRFLGGLRTGPRRVRGELSRRRPPRSAPSAPTRAAPRRSHRPGR